MMEAFEHTRGDVYTVRVAITLMVCLFLLELRAHVR